MFIINQNGYLQDFAGYGGIRGDGWHEGGIGERQGISGRGARAVAIVDSLALLLHTQARRTQSSARYCRHDLLDARDAKNTFATKPC